MAIMLPRQPSWAESLAGGFGSGLSSGLQALTNLKMQDMQRQQQFQEMYPLLDKMNMPREFAPLLVQSRRQSGNTGQALKLLTDPGMDYKKSPTYQTQLLKNFERRLGRIIGGNKNLASSISSLAYDNLDKNLLEGMNPNTAIANALNEAKIYKEQVPGERKVIKPIQAGAKEVKAEAIAPKRKRTVQKLKTADVDRFLKDANYDVDKAKELARQAGFEV